MSDHRAKKWFGQNFLKVAWVLDRIIESIPEDGGTIVEIGPGLGDLTERLVATRSVVAYEVDRDLCVHLGRRLASALEDGRLVLHCGDVLEYWQAQLLPAPYVIVANLPYYIATNLILKALQDSHCRSLTVMVQKEVAEKFSAASGEKEFGSLAILAQSQGDVRLLFEVGPECFSPPPKVDSAILQIIKNGKTLPGGMESFLRHAFAQPRKKLSKNLLPRYGKAVSDAFFAVGLEPNVRPHEVSTAAYHLLYDFLHKGDPHGEYADTRV